jgi:rubrerythrin
MEEGETKRQLKLIGDVALEHAEKTAQMIYKLGGTPSADLLQCRPRSGLREILEAHIEGEKASIDVYARTAGKAESKEIREMLDQMRQEEEGHLRLLQRVLERV